MVSLIEWWPNGVYALVISITRLKKQILPGDVLESV